MMKSKISITGKSLEEMLIDCSIDAIIAVDSEKKIIAWNTIAEKIYGKNKHTVIGTCLQETIPSIAEDEETLKAIRLALVGIKSFVPVSKKYYHRHHAENHFIPLKNENKIIGVMNLVHDVGHRIKAEEQLQHLNEQLEQRFRLLQIAADELATFTYLTSNKIKEPVRHIYTGIEHLIKTEAIHLSDGGKASFRRIQSSLHRMDLLLDDMLSLAQVSILQKTDALVDLNELMTEISSQLKEKSEKKMEISWKKLSTITGHQQYLHLLFYNLLDNATKFNENPVPMVNISGENVFLNRENKDPFLDTEYYKVTVSDNGIGFEDKDKDRIFKMFEKLHDKAYKGSGMGLTIVQKIMDAHGGFMQVESEPGKGSSFHCFFPIGGT